MKDENVESIIVVAPDKYKSLARKICHSISKNSDFAGSPWSIKQYEQNEFNLISQQYVLFIGNEKENKLVKDYLAEIQNLEDKAGVCYGFDDTKAVIFGKGKLEQEKDFKDLQKSVIAGLAAAAKVAKNPSIATATATGTIIASSLMGPFKLLIYYGVFKFVSKKIKERKLLKEQTKLAVTLFLLNHFDKWIGQEK